MTTGLSWDGSVLGTVSFVKNIAELAVVQEDNTDFLAILPMAITYAENRIYRELDFVFTSIVTTSYSFTVGSRELTVPQGTFVVPEQINVITGTSLTPTGRFPLLPTTREYLDAVYGSASVTGMPQYFCVFDDYRFLVGPYPDSNYIAEIVGTIRPDSLSAGNSTTFISLYLPDLFIMAVMIYISGYQRNFGKQSDSPDMAVSYEQQYQLLKQGATSEEERKRFAASAWSSQGPSPLATPTRGA